MSKDIPRYPIGNVGSLVLHGRLFP